MKTSTRKKSVTDKTGPRTDKFGLSSALKRLKKSLKTHASFWMFHFIDAISDFNQRPDVSIQLFQDFTFKIDAM